MALGLFLHEPLACLLPGLPLCYHFISGFPVLLLNKRSAQSSLRQVLYPRDKLLLGICAQLHLK